MYNTIPKLVEFTLNVDHIKSGITKKRVYFLQFFIVAFKQI